MPTLAAFEEANDNAELVSMAADLAYDAIASYYDARDLPVPVCGSDLKDQALEIAFAGAKDWTYQARDANDRRWRDRDGSDRPKWSAVAFWKHRI